MNTRYWTLGLLALLLAMPGAGMVADRAHGARGASVGPAANSSLLANNLDPTFGSGGIVTSAPSQGDNMMAALVVQPDGKLVVAGSTDEQDRDITLARYTASGQLDATFGNGGIATADFGGNDQAAALVIQPDGKLVVAGSSDASGVLDVALARFMSSGTLDRSFDGDGKVLTDIDGTDNAARALVLQPDGRLVVAGDALSLETFDGDFALARFTASGALDRSFGGDGSVLTDLGGVLDRADALALLPDGRMVAAGSDGSNFALARFTSSGSLDSSFSGDGKALTNIDEGGDVITALALQPDGKLITAGYTSSGSDFVLARYASGGSLDQSFGDGGTRITDFGGRDTAMAVVLQPDGRIVAAGGAGGGQSDDVGLARYTANGALDTSFGSAGTASTDILGGDDLATAVALQADGRIVVAGRANQAGRAHVALARYLAEGTAPLRRSYLPLVSGAR